MKKLFFLLIAGSIATLSLSKASGFLNHFHTERLQSDPVLLLSRSFNISDIKNVNVQTSGGAVTVSGDATAKASIEVFGQGNNGKRLSKDEILEVLKNDYEFSVTAENGTLSAIAKRKVTGMWKKAVNISFKVHVGRNTNTDLHTSGGSISLSSLQGAENFKTSGGSIHFDNLSGNINGNTSGGSITALKSKGNIKAHTSGGSLDIKDLEGNIQMHTSGGSIQAANVTGDNLDLSTSGGSIHLENISAKLTANTSGGSINADLTRLTQDADLSTSGGSIRISIPKVAKVNFELRGSRVNIGAANNIQVQMNKQKSAATGSLNNGGVHLNAHTSGGTVSLDFK